MIPEILRAAKEADSYYSEGALYLGKMKAAEFFSLIDPPRFIQIIKAARAMAEMAETMVKHSVAYKNAIADERMSAGFEDCAVHLDMAVMDWRKLDPES